MIIPTAIKQYYFSSSRFVRFVITVGIVLLNTELKINEVMPVSAFVSISLMIFILLFSELFHSEQVLEELNLHPSERG